MAQGAQKIGEFLVLFLLQLILVLGHSNIKIRTKKGSDSWTHEIRVHQTYSMPLWTLPLIWTRDCWICSPDNYHKAITFQNLNLVQWGFQTWYDEWSLEFLLFGHENVEIFMQKSDHKSFLPVLFIKVLFASCFLKIVFTKLSSTAAPRFWRSPSF